MLHTSSRKLPNDDSYLHYSLMNQNNQEEEEEDEMSWAFSRHGVEEECV
jgi:hypothetical protein